MLVNIENKIINTQTITVVREEAGRAVAYFNSDYMKYIELSTSLSEFIEHLNSVGVTIRV